MNYSNKLMLVDLSISTFGGRKYDKKISQEVAQQHNTTVEVGRYNKNLFPTNPPSYKAIIVAASQARVKHYSLTLPWNDDGCRVLAAKAYMDYTDAMRTEQLKFESAVNDFVPQYPGIKAESLRILNGMASPDDFPKDTEISEYFGLNLRFLPFPDSADVRVNLPQADIDAIRTNVEGSTKEALQKAMLDPIQRLHSCVARMAETLSTPDGIFRDSLVTNLESLRALLPTLNVTDDPTLDALFAKTDELVTHEPDTLRHSPVVRSTVAEKAEALRKQLEGYF